MANNTKILFPRFQYETNPDENIPKRELKWVVDPQPHLNASPLKEMTTIKRIARRRPPYRIATPWYGEWHTHGYTVSEPLEVPDIPFADKFDYFRTTLIDHRYSWDSQSTEGVAQEVVLEGEREGQFTVLAAVLAVKNTGFTPRPDEGQRFIAVHDEVCEAPLPGEDIYLTIMRRVAMHGSDVTVG